MLSAQAAEYESNFRFCRFQAPPLTHPSRRSVLVLLFYTLSEAWSGMNWADLMAAQGAFPLGPIFMTGLYSVQSIVPTIVLVDMS